MSIKIALVGNPNSGKTTLFNALTGSNQYVGNWPGVTVEKKEGRIKWNKEVILTDLPGVYSLSPYTPEEIVARNYLVEEHPSAIINIVDGTNLERNLYLTTQLLDFGIPMVIAVNFMDIVAKRGIKLNLKKVSDELGCKVIEISALKNKGIKEVALEAIEVSAKKSPMKRDIFSPKVESALGKIERIISHGYIEENELRWMSVKLFERDEEICAHIDLNEKAKEEIEATINEVEAEFDDDSIGVLTSERYDYVTKIVDKRMPGKEKMSVSDKIDRIVTNRWLAIPIFALVMFGVYYLAIGSIGDWTVGFMNDKLFGEWIVPGATSLLEGWGVADWLVGLIADGAIGGVGAVLGFVPQMLILFLLLSLLEDCGYMSRVAFIMDRLFRRFGLSGKSFIPMLIASGCGVPGIMASRTIEQQNDRKITIMTTGFIPCGAKMPIVSFIAGSLFRAGLEPMVASGEIKAFVPGLVAALVSTSAWFIGVGAVITSGIILKKFKAFAGHPSPFVMELPEYHAPAPINILKTTWERGWSFIKRAGTVILLASVLIWIANNVSLEPSEPSEYSQLEDGTIISAEDGAPSAVHAHAIYDEEGKIIGFEVVEHEGMHFIEEGCTSKSILQVVGECVSIVFKPLGFGDSWEASVATILGLVAKEEVVGAIGSLAGTTDDALGDMEAEDDPETEENEAEIAKGNLSRAADEFFDGSFLKGFSFMIFNLLCAPCFAAIGAIKNEMNNRKWTIATISYMTGFAYAMSLIVYQIGKLFRWGSFSVWTVIAFVLLAVFLYLLFKPARLSLINIVKKIFTKKEKSADKISA
ncbi:MAG: ferrous iron transport protein B [Clostridia bacterium]|nr:ferrous iron transport protein B [Clostridia bacterium]